MLTPTGQPPAALPPPKRRFIGRRINRVPAAIAVGVGLVVAGSVAYTMHERGEQDTDRRQTEAEPAPSDASSVLKDRPSGYIQPAAIHLNPSPKVESAISSTPASPPANNNPPPEDDNGLEKERKAAWDRYWSEYEDIRKKRFEQRQAALTAKTSVATGQASGEAPAGANAAASPQAPAAAPSTPSGLPGIGGYGSWSGFAGLPGLGGFGYGLGPAPQIDTAAQQQKVNWENRAGATGQDDVLPRGRTPAPSPYMLMTGDYIPFALIGRVNSDIPGRIVGRVTTAVYDSAGHAACPLIPQGAKIVGTYNSQVSYGQNRVQFALERIIYPDNSSVDLGSMPGADVEGAAGGADLVNRHIGNKVFNAVLIGGTAALAQLTQPQSLINGRYNAQQIATANLGQQFGQLGAQMGQQALSQPDTLELRPGLDLNVEMTKDAAIEPWPCGDAHAMPNLPIMTGDN